MDLNEKKDREILDTQSFYNAECLRISEELKKLNLENERFEIQLFNGLIGKLNSKLYEVYIDETKLVSKYGLNEFSNKLIKNKKLYNYFKNSCSGAKKNKISFRTIKYLYEKISNEMCAAIEFIKIIEEYKKSNFQINNLIKKRDIVSLGYKDVLFSHTEEVFKYIENEEIKEIGYRMYEEYKQYIEESRKLYTEINELQQGISEKLHSSEKPSLEQLKEYRNRLKSEIFLFTQAPEETSNNLKK